MTKTMVKPSGRDNTIFSLGALLRLRSSFMLVAPLSLLLLVLSAGRGHAFSNGISGTKLSAVGKGGIATTAALSAATSKTIAGALTKIPQGNLAVSAVLSAGTLLFSGDQVEASDYGICYSTNFPGNCCSDINVCPFGDDNCCNYGSNDDNPNYNCCNYEYACQETSGAAIGCCSCNGKRACQYSNNAVFYDNVCNAESACNHSPYIRVYSISCISEGSCQYSPYLTVGSNSCNAGGACTHCCNNSNKEGNCINNPDEECNSESNACVTIPNGECNDPGNLFDGTNYPSCPWCPYCKNTDGTSCYNTQMTGQATLNNEELLRALQSKKSKQKDKASKKTPMNCASVKDKIVSYFQKQSIPKLRSKYVNGEVAEGSDNGGHRKRSRDCNVELSWLFKHLEEDELVPACAELENHKKRLQAYLGNGWTLKNLKCVPEDKNKMMVGVF